MFDGVPFLVREPEQVASQWRGRLRAMLARLERQAATYRSHLTDAVTRANTRNRLKLLAAACDDHARRLRALLAPLLDGDAKAESATYAALAPTESPSLNPLAYYANVHRDWCWGEDENTASLEAVRDALQPRPPGRTLVLGAGAGRLAYDLHEALAPACTVAADLNPLLAFVAQRMYAGTRLELYEFPLAPRDRASHALLRTLGAPRPAREGLQVVLADARTVPFAPGSFDTVVTPWLVDVVDTDLATLATTINRLLAPGGRWVCTGSLFFQQSDPTQAYASEEVGEVVAAAGFTPPRLHERRVPYLASPASRHVRHEDVVTFVVERVADAAPVPDAGPVPWLADVRASVPLLIDVAQRALALRVEAYVASLVDGRRSIAEIAARLVQERLLLPDEAVGVVADYLRRLVATANGR